LDHEQATRRFYDLIWPHRADVLRVAQFLSRNSAAAEDLAQETLLKAFRGIDRLVAGPDVKAWLLLILRNTWRDRMRSEAGRAPEASLDTLCEEPATQTDAAAETWGEPGAIFETFSDQQVIDALQALPEEIRWTLLLVDVEGMTLQEAADVLEVPVGTIKSRAHRGRRMLREVLLPLAREMKLIETETSAATRPRQ
jgi:RNA polymerase sigma-70 factor (ECF subfamily)